VKAEELVVGRIYLLRGGNVLRYTGKFTPTSRCHSFRSPSDEDWTPSGYSALIEEVTRELKLPEDREFLTNRRMNCEVRNLMDEAARMTLVLDELEKSSSPVRETV
jgi:hypothetical protein